MSDNFIQLNEAAIKGELKDLVNNSVEETFNDYSGPLRATCPDFESHHSGE